jgi:hypothetical protein
MPTNSDTAPGPDLEPMFEQPTLGILLKAIDELARDSCLKGRARGYALINKIVENSGELDEEDLARMNLASRAYLRDEPDHYELLEAFLR